MPMHRLVLLEQGSRCEMNHERWSVRREGARIDYDPFRLRMKMDTIRSLQMFVRAVELGSLSAVAREQRTTQPTVSKLIAGLERNLGVHLLERRTSGLTTSEEGRRFFERAKAILEDLDEAVDDARGLTQTPAGLLRINAPLALGELRLNALVLEFLALHPGIEIELILNDRFVDLIEESVDLALRLGGPLPEHVVARRVAVSPRWLVCSPAYLEGRPDIRQPQDLSKHDAVRFAWVEKVDVMELDGPGGGVTVPVRGRYRVNSSIAVRESLVAGAGFELAPAWLVQDLLESGQLVRVLPRWHGPAQEAFVLYPRRRYQPIRARVFTAFLVQRFVQLPGFSV